ncbi:MAG: helix-turn-helix domain-containing protein [Bacteroidales bacterium]|nr:helix-turn-helix domain-containing protein [Bacteroidales bacterium]
MTDYYEYSVPELVRMLGARFREYRLMADMTQQEVAKQSGLSVATVHKFESGSATGLSLSTFLLLMKAVSCIDQLENVFPEIPVSPYLLTDDGKKVQRIRH